MGSGPRFSFGFTPERFSIGICAMRFPHALSIYIDLGWHSIYLGFGKGYDE